MQVYFYDRIKLLVKRLADPIKPQQLLRSMVLMIFLFYSGMMTACSPRMFSRDALDQSLHSESSPKNPIRTQCSAVKFEGDRLTVPLFRALVDCMNSSQQIHAAQSWLDSLSDTTLEPVVESLNEVILKRPQIIYGLENFIRQLEDSDGEYSWQTLAQDLQEISSHPEWIQIFVQALLHEDRDGELLLKAPLQQWSQNISADQIDQKLGLFELILKVKEKYALNFIVDDHTTPEQLFAFLKLLSKTDFLDESVHSVAQGTFWKVKDKILGTTQESMIRNVPQLEFMVYSFFHEIEKGSIAARSFSELSEQLKKPLRCAKGGYTFPDPQGYFIDELIRQSPAQWSDFLLKQHPLTLLGVQPACAYPQGMTESYLGIRALARSNAVEAGASIIHHLVEGGMKTWLQRSFEFGGQSDALPLIQTVTESRKTLDLLLPGIFLESSDVDQLSRVARSVEEHLPVLKQWLGSLTLDEVKKIQQVLVSLSADSHSVSPADHTSESLYRLRRLTISNDSHPLIEISKMFLDRVLHSKKDRQSLDAMVNGSQSAPLFSEALKSLHQLARDGSLRKLSKDLVALFHKTAQRGREPIQMTPPQQMPLARQLRFPIKKEDFKLLTLNQKIKKSSCDEIRFDRRLENQLEILGKCIGQDASIYQGLVTLQSMKRPSDRRSILEMIDDYVWNWTLTPEESSILIRDLAPWVQPTSSHSVGSTISPARDWMNWVGQVFRSGFFPKGVEILGQVLKTSRDSVNQVMLTLADWMESAKVQAVYPLVRDYLNQPLDSSVWPPETSITFDRERIKRWVHNKECLLSESGDDSQILNRVQQIEFDFKNAVNGWERQDGQVRTQWSWDEWSQYLETILKLSSQKPGVIGAVQNIFERHSSDELYDWIQKRTTDQRMVTFYYPGEKNLQVRVMSSLDMIDQILVGADFSFFNQGNFAVKYMKQLGEAWGDEPRETWPKEIQALYPGSKRPKTLRQALEDIESELNQFLSLAGTPSVPHCDQIDDPQDPDDAVSIGTLLRNPLVPFKYSAILYNMKSLLPVMKDNLPDSGSSQAGGLRLIRDAAFELREFADMFPVLGRSGALRQVTLAFKSLSQIREQDREQLKSLVKELSQLLQDPHAVHMMELFLYQKNQTNLKTLAEGMFKNKNKNEWTQVGMQTLQLASRYQLFDSTTRLMDEVVSQEWNSVTRWIDLQKDSLESAQAPKMMRQVLQGLLNEKRIKKQKTIKEFLQTMLSIDYSKTFYRPALRAMVDFYQPQLKTPILDFLKIARSDRLNFDDRLFVLADYLLIPLLTGVQNGRVLTPVELSYRKKLIHFIAQLLRSRDLVEWTDASSDTSTHQPQKLQVALEGVADFLQSQGFGDFIKQVDRTLNSH